MRSPFLLFQPLTKHRLLAIGFGVLVAASFPVLKASAQDLGGTVNGGTNTANTTAPVNTATNNNGGQGFVLPDTQDNRTFVFNGNKAQDFLNGNPNAIDPPRPRSLREIQDLEKENKTDKSGLAFDIRKEAIREAAISFGARSGLAWRTFEIRDQLRNRGRNLDKIYNFSHLLIPAPSGLLIEPPIINEAINSMIIADGGQQAAVSDRIYNIVNNAKIVSNSRTWRDYLLREWGDIAPPPDILRPENKEEREFWRELVARGWAEGVQQADEIFEDDLNSLTNDFRGMVRYRVLLAQSIISPPYALQVDRGITAGDGSLRIGDRAVQITGVPEFVQGSDQWQPADR